MNGFLNGKIAVVTGGANGIGRASALRLAQEGADIAALDLEADRLEVLAADIGKIGRRVLTIALDLTVRAAVADAFARIRKDFGVVDVLVNNVGQTARERSREFWCSEPETWDFVMNVSLMTTMMCSRQVVPEMRERKSGKIVSIASDSAFYGDVNLVDYCAAKAGVIGFTRALARELAPHGVNANAVAPGPTRTRAAERMPPGAFEKSLTAVPQGRMGDPEDIANAVNFLATDQSRYVTGQVLVVDGGRVFR